MKKKLTLTQILLGLVILLIGVELLVHCTRKSEPVKAQTMSYLCDDTIMFDLANVLYIEDAGNDTGYKITYGVNDSTNIEMFTSIMEGDYLMYSLDCLAVYNDFEDEEEIDNIISYFLNNSHVTYLSNPWFQGFTWTWDACPAFRY